MELGGLLVLCGRIRLDMGNSHGEFLFCRWLKSTDFSTKPQRARKKSSRPRADASGGERALLRHAALGIRQKNGGVGQMPTEKGRFSSSGVSGTMSFYNQSASINALCALEE